MPVVLAVKTCLPTPSRIVFFPAANLSNYHLDCRDSTSGTHRPEVQPISTEEETVEWTRGQRRVICREPRTTSVTSRSCMTLTLTDPNTWSGLLHGSRRCLDLVHPPVC